MPLVKQTPLGRKYLKKEVAQSDFGAITATHLYDKQLGSDGANNNVFTLPSNYAIGSNTLLVFVNGIKATQKIPATTQSEYEEVSSRVVRFGAPLNSTDVIEFLVAGTWTTDMSMFNVYSTLNPVPITSSYVAGHLDRVLVDSRVGALQVNLPLNPSKNTIIEIIDAGGQALSNNITINRNGSLIEGLPDNLVLNYSGLHVFLIYIDSAYGWKYSIGFNSKMVPLAENALNLGGEPAAVYATREWVTLQGFATQEWVNSSSYASESWVNDGFVPRDGYIQAGKGMLNFYYEGVAQVDDIVIDGVNFSTDIVITAITLNARVAPTGGSLSAKILLDGIEQDNFLLLTDGANYETTPINLSCTPDQRFGLIIKTVGSIEEGQGITFSVTYHEV
jgi:hypothetical protein